MPEATFNADNQWQTGLFERHEDHDQERDTRMMDNDQNTLQPEFLQLALDLQNLGHDGVQEMVCALRQFHRKRSADSICSFSSCTREPRSAFPRQNRSL
jgi:hypothetical protein